MIDFKKVKEKFKAFQDARRFKHRNWIESFLFYVGYQWLRYKNEGLFDLSEDERLKRHLHFFVEQNRILSDVYTLVAKLTRIEPRIMVKAPVYGTKSHDAMKKEMINTYFLRHLFLKEEFLPTMHEHFILYLAIFGTAGVLVSKRPERYVVDDEGTRIVDVGIRLLSPFDFWVDPTKERYRDHEEVFVLTMMPVETVEKLYNIKLETTQKYAMTNLYNILNEAARITPATISVPIVEYYKKPSINDEKGAYVVFIPDMNEPLHTAEWTDRLPVIWTDLYHIPGCTYGHGVVDEAKSYQAYINFLLSIGIEDLIVTGLNRIAIPEGSLVKWSDSPSEPIVYRPNTLLPNAGAPHMIQGMPLSGAFVGILEKLYQQYHDLISVQAVDLGRAAASDPAIKVQLLSIKSTERLDIMSKKIKWVWSKVGQMLLKLAKEVYKGKKEFIIPDQIGVRKFAIRPDDILDNAEVYIDMGTDLPFSRAELIALIFQTAYQTLIQNPADLRARAIVKEILELIGLANLAEKFVPELPSQAQPLGEGSFLQNILGGGEGGEQKERGVLEEILKLSQKGGKS